MSKEAMKLALEALQEVYWSSRSAKHDEAITALREALAEQPAPVQQGWKMVPVHPTDEMRDVGNVIIGDRGALFAAYRAMLAAAPQPAQQEQYIGETNVELGFYSDDASNGQQRELVGKVEMGQLVGNRPHESTSNPDTEREIAVITGVDEHGPMLGWFKHWINYPVGTKLYTSPSAQPAQQEPDYKALYEKAVQQYNDLAELMAEQPAQQEPVAYGMWDTMLGKGNRMMMVRLDKGQDGCTVPLYTSPPAQRTWVGLSDLNIDELENEYMKSAQTAHEFLRAIEAKLKEKNA